MLRQERVADDLGLLFEPVAVEQAVGDEVVAIAAEWVPHQREVEAPAGLRLPDVRHFMDEQSLAVQRLLPEVVRPQIVMRVEVDVPGRRHHGVPWLEPPPFATDHADSVVGNRLAKDRAGKLDLLRREGARRHDCRIASPRS